MLKKIFNYFGYTFTRFKKSTSIDEIIKLRLKYENVDILLDVGANKGEFTNFFINDFKYYHLFEPNKDLVKELKLKFYDKNINIYNFGLGIKNEITYLNITNDTASTLSSIKKQTAELKNNFRNTNVVYKEKIQIKRTDEFLDSINLHNEKIFLKIDTQGNDFETLKSIGNYYNNVKFLKIEMPCIKLYETNYDHWDILEFLKEKNFKPVYFENISRTKKGELIEYDCFFEKNEI